MSDVPSNLIPTRITQLPVAPVADENSLMMIVYQGNNYQIRVGDLLSVAGVPTTTQVIAGTGMTGGGQLTGNVTLSVAPKGINSTLINDTGVAAGVYGNSTDIPIFTVDSTGRVTAATTIPATISGYVPVSTQVIAGNGLTGGGALNSNVTLAASYSASAPQAGFQSGSAGAANTLARSDHKHPAVDLSADDQVDNLLGLGNGGTARSLVAAAGAIVWSGADGLYIGPVGLAGQVLVSGGAGAPTWGSALLVVDQPANVVYAGPTAGPDAPTSFRALVNADLPASGVSANTYGSSTAIPVLTVNAKGVITSATTASFTGGLSYQGSWNALTNTPTLTSSVGTNGYYYIVSVAGSTNLNGITDWQVGDWAIYNGTVWQKIDQTNLVSSVNGQTGVVSIGYADLAGSIPTWNQNTTGTAANVTGTVAILNGGTGQTTASAAFNALSPITTTGDLILGTGVNTASRLAIGANGYLLTSNGTTAAWAAAPAAGVTSFAGGTTGLTPASATTGAITLAGTLAVANGGTGVTTSSGANSVVLRDASQNIIVNALDDAYTNVAAAGTTTTLTVASARRYTVTGSGGQTFQLPNATTLVNGAIFEFDNNQSSGAITVNNNSGTLVVSVPSGGIVRVNLLSNASAAGSWDRHDLTPANVSWSTNTLDYPGSITSATWNGVTIGVNRGGTGLASYTIGDTLYASGATTLSKLALGTINYVMTAGASAPQYVAQSTLSVGSATTATTATNLAGGVASQIPYQTGAGATAFIANGTAGQVLTSAGTGAPVFSGINGGTF